MGLRETRAMHVEKVSVINGMAGDDWLYQVNLTDRNTGEKLAITDWGRDLKVPIAGSNVDVRAARGTWRQVDIATRSKCFPELSGLGRIEGTKHETGYVGPLNYYDGHTSSTDTKTKHIPTTFMRCVDRIADFLDPAKWVRRASA